MVEMQLGKISVDSTPGEGSRFTCRYAGCLVAAEESDLDEYEVDDVAEVVYSSENQGRRILLVEDNPVNRKLARNVLRSRGYEVVEATSGEEALRKLRSYPADLVLMDIQLPGMDGLEVTRRLKADPSTAALPIVALTAHAQEQDEIDARQAGCIGYITKPIRLAQFPGEVESYLSGSVGRNIASMPAAARNRSSASAALG